MSISIVLNLAVFCSDSIPIGSWLYPVTAAKYQLFLLLQVLLLLMLPVLTYGFLDKFELGIWFTWRTIKLKYGLAAHYKMVYWQMVYWNMISLVFYLLEYFQVGIWFTAILSSLRRVY